MFADTAWFNVEIEYDSTEQSGIFKIGDREEVIMKQIQKPSSGYYGLDFEKYEAYYPEDYEYVIMEDGDGIKIEQILKPTVIYHIQNIDFGLEKRPETKIELNKEIAGIKITLASGEVIIDTEKRSNPKCSLD